MATYLVLNLTFLVIIGIAVRRSLATPSLAWLAMVTVLIIMTAVFDSLIVSFGIVGYDSNKILGLYIGRAPVEDFFYALLAAMIIPVLWNKFKKTQGDANK